MAYYDYRWGAGHGLALASLKNVENELYPYNKRSAGGASFPVGIVSQPVDRFPVRTALASGEERGDGFVTHAWDLKLTKLAVKYILDTYLSSGAVMSVPVTIYTRRHELDAYARYSCYLILPQPGADLEYMRQGVFRLRLRFRHLVAL
jgi:hypothetical protein